MKYKEEFDDIMAVYNSVKENCESNGLIFKDTVSYFFSISKLKLLKYNIKYRGCGNSNLTSFGTNHICGTTFAGDITICQQCQNLINQIEELLK